MKMWKQTLEVVMKPFELPSATPPAGFNWPCEIQHQEMLPSLGNPAAMSCFFKGFRSVALRPTLSRGLPFSSKNYINNLFILGYATCVNDMGHQRKAGDR
jgi:hypothetical protein